MYVDDEMHLNNQNSSRPLTNEKRKSEVKSIRHKIKQTFSA
jgi:hypothetical protein